MFILSVFDLNHKCCNDRIYTFYTELPPEHSAPYSDWLSIFIYIIAHDKYSFINTPVTLPFGFPEDFIEVSNYWEAAGYIACVKLGMDPLVVRRPVIRTKVEKL